jgi:hypothetical protein
MKDRIMILLNIEAVISCDECEQLTEAAAVTAGAE